MKLVANRPFISLRTGFVVLGQELTPSNPEYNRMLKAALKDKEDKVANPVWVVVDKPVDKPVQKLFEELPMEVLQVEELPVEEVAKTEDYQEEPKENKKKGKKSE